MRCLAEMPGDARALVVKAQIAAQADDMPQAARLDRSGAGGIARRAAMH